jgi:hypothetical protein
MRSVFNGRRKVAEEIIIGYRVFIQAPEGPIQAQRVLIVAPEDTVFWL